MCKSAHLIKLWTKDTFFTSLQNVYDAIYLFRTELSILFYLLFNSSRVEFGKKFHEVGNEFHERSE